MPSPPERRAALRARHRAAVLDVVRHTLVNHQSSLQEVVVTCLETELDQVTVAVDLAADATGDVAGQPEDPMPPRAERTS